MRIRTIKPEFFNHAELFDAEKETKLPIRLAYIGLWCAADREGRFKWEPRRLGVQILPYDNIDFSRVLDACLTRGFIVGYALSDASTTPEYGYIPSFTKHQVINNRERESELPNPLECKRFDACPTRAPRVPHAGKGEGKGKEGNKEGKGTGKEGDWRVSDACLALGPDKRAVLEKWVAYRIGINKPLRSASMETIIESWTDMELWKIAGAVKTSIENGWQGLFPEKVTIPHADHEQTLRDYHAEWQAAPKIGDTDHELEPELF
jgi:hypothetical protein